jgi:hypothetical protein
MVLPCVSDCTRGDEARTWWKSVEETPLLPMRCDEGRGLLGSLFGLSSAVIVVTSWSIFAIISSL